MLEVGVRMLKAHLSEYLRRANEGECIVVTDRGRQVAELRPLSRERVLVDNLAARGTVRLGSGERVGRVGISLRGGDLSDTVLDDR
jgi:prevent-host-death family protein